MYENVYTLKRVDTEVRRYLNRSKCFFCGQISCPYGGTKKFSAQTTVYSTYIIPM